MGVKKPMNYLISRMAKYVGLVLVALLFFVTVMSGVTHAGNDSQSNSGRLITIHDRGTEKVLVSQAETIGDVLKEAGIAVDSKDAVEPAVTEKLVASDYQVNIYRARPVIIVDGNTKTKINTPYQTAAQIVESVGLKLYDEDKTEITLADNVIAEGASLKLIIDRATSFTFNLYGNTTIARTQVSTVGEMLAEKGIKLGSDDKVSLPADTKITEGLEIKVWREGKQTITVNEEMDFTTEKIQDVDRAIGYREIRIAGIKGSRTVSYEVLIENGQEVSRTEIASLTISEPKKQVEVIGAKPAFSGDFVAALTKLRSCEGGYSSWNASGPYYGAYQFDRQTWGTVADPSKYGSASPAEQDDAAYKLYLRRGWQPWPVCGAAVLQDIYR